MADAVRRCPVCEHPSVLAINHAILNNKSYRAIARDFRIGSEASGTFRPDHKKVVRHAEGCMATSYQQVQEESLSTQGRAIQERMKWLDEQVDVVVADALAGEVLMLGDVPLLNDDGSEKRIRTVAHLRALLAAVREGRQNQALLAKLAGALPEGDDDADLMRQALENPEARRLVQELERVLAEAAQAAGQNQIES